MRKLALVITGILLVGAGCNYKYEANWNNQDQASQHTPDRPACNMEGEEAYPELPCCGGLVMTTSTAGYKVCTKPKTTNSGQASGKCVQEGQQAESVNGCCPGLIETAVDDGYSICAKEPGYKPRVCAAPGEVLTADTPNCCAGLDAKEQNGQWICQSIY